MGLHLGAEKPAKIWQDWKKGMSADLKQETVSEAVKATPALAGAVYSNMTLNEWVAVATLLYIIIQIIILCWKQYWAVQDRKRGDAVED